jgi:hypothetical protein
MPLKEHFHVSERSVYRYLEIISMIDGIEFDQDRIACYAGVSCENEER